MRLLDLFAGRKGWSKAFEARKWETVCVDLVMPPNLTEWEKLNFLLLDVLSLTAEWVRKGNFDFACASSPCEEFSVWGMKHFHPHPKYPENGIKLLNHTREILERQRWTAEVATIPPELASCVADYAERILEQRTVMA